jgi:hypothetical protein
MNAWRYSNDIYNLPLLYSEAYNMDCAIVINSVLPSSRDWVLESESNVPTKLKPAKREEMILITSGYHRFHELSKILITPTKLVTQRV